MTSDPFHDFLQSIPVRPPRKVKPKKQPIPLHIKQRYYDAHELDFKNKYPVAYKEGKYFQCAFPDTYTANGLTQAIVKFILWNGYRATRVMSSGRVIGGKYVPGSTRRGAADISSTIKGMSVMWEIKINFDKPSKEQLREQELEERAGGKYFFVKTFEQFLTIYDTL